MAGILLIGEDSAQLEAVAVPLEQRGYQLALATDQHLGWLLFVSMRPSVIILDLDLARMAGMALLPKIRAKDQDAIVIGLTRIGGDARRQAALELGANHVLQPPWTPADFEHILGPPLPQTGAAASLPPAPPPPHDRLRATVLLIDDDGAVRQLFRQALEGEGYDVVEAPTGTEGLRLLHERPVDVVLTDIIMPDMDGLEVVRELRRDFPTVRIIAFTGGRLERDYSATARLLGAHETLMKPLGVHEVLAAVARQMFMRR